ncbi:DUF6476 family protein [Marinibaculum pumilum]|uniref:DUF6476 family protein n=1 Tax=Marinibaculum pumilum TaxID=1766165 RepID=A0ABV7KXU2_9PROT
MTRDKATDGTAGGGRSDGSDAEEDQDEGGPNLALLKWIVIGLGVLIVIGLGVVVVTVANRMGGSSATATDPVRLPAAFGRAAIQAGPETEIVDANAGGDVILLTLRAPGRPDSVVVLDAATGQERGRLELERRLPEGAAPASTQDPAR